MVERRSEEQSLRLEALPRSLPSGSQSCLLDYREAPGPRTRPPWSTGPTPNWSVCDPATRAPPQIRSGADSEPDWG